MQDIVNDVLPLIQSLVPGFLMMTVFYWFAEVPKPGQFERTIQALIATAIIQVLINIIESAAHGLGRVYSIGPWSPDAALVFSIVLAFLAGLYLAYLCNQDKIYEIARKLKITSKASVDDASHIYKTLGQCPVVLQLTDGRRLMGFYSIFPNSKQTGSFLIEQPHWLQGEEIIPCETTRAIHITGSDVHWVEFLEPTPEDEEKKNEG